jgi:hypothetical protein
MLMWAVGVLWLAGSGGNVAGQPPTPIAATTYRLASAQVVTSTQRPPMLKLSASGPIAFQVLPTDASGDPVGPGRVVARLFGVAPGDLASSGDLAPFALTVMAAASANGTDTDTIVTITTGAVASDSGERLVLRPGMKSNEIEAAIVPVE